ncbi:hypothetical protein BH11PSE8_BH11PSE8_24660 [soil metagenome]
MAIVPSVALFVDRARAVRADFHIGPRNAKAIVEIVHRLEGMPLALELAAAQGIGAARCEALWREGAAMTLADAVALALRARTRPSGAD